MSVIFHRNDILKDPAHAWQAYKSNPDFFKFPERITVEITNRCNLKCSMCPRNNVAIEPLDMPIELFEKVIDEAAQFLPICFVPFFRGESLLHPQFIEMLSYAKVRGLKPIQLATNAYFLDEQLGSKILDLEIDFLSFSVDVNNPEVYKKIRKNSDFESVFSNILHFLSEKEKREANLPLVQISAVKTKENVSFMKDFISFWKRKADRVRIYYVHSQDGRLGHNQKDDVGKWQRKPCLKLLSDIVIYSNGQVALCNHDWQRQEFIGDVTVSSIVNIWNNPVYKSIRQRHLDNNLSGFTPCNYCSYWQAPYLKEAMIGEVYEKD
ncbi:MAG: radical SAM protein [Omnitrophica bacterium]|nr:radical SAM protein [Candidatus Omnitrophota bacterium]